MPITRRTFAKLLGSAPVLLSVDSATANLRATEQKMEATVAHRLHPLFGVMAFSRDLVEDDDIPVFRGVLTREDKLPILEHGVIQSTPYGDLVWIRVPVRTSLRLDPKDVESPYEPKYVLAGGQIPMYSCQTAALVYSDRSPTVLKNRLVRPMNKVLFPEQILEPGPEFHLVGGMFGDEEPARLEVW